MIKSMDMAKSDKYILKKFGISLSIVFLLITLLIFKKSGRFIWPTFLLSFLFFVTALIKPFLLKPVQAILARIGLVMNWIFSRLILFIVFYLLFTPMGLIIKLFRGDLLDRKIEKCKDSYWRKKEKNTLGPLGYEKQF